MNCFDDLNIKTFHGEYNLEMQISQTQKHPREESLEHR